MVLTSAVGVRDRVAGDEPGAVSRGDRVDGQACAHVRRDGVPDQLFAAQVQDDREVEPALGGRVK